MFIYVYINFNISKTKAAARLFILMARLHFKAIEPHGLLILGCKMAAIVKLFS